MKNYSRAEIELFLRAIDEQLKKKFALVVIGGTAAALAYGAQDYTRDIDTVTNLNPIEDAYEAAKQKTGLDIPMEPVGVWDAPYNYEDRLEVYPIKGARHLLVQVPEKHDLALMKMIRGQANDIETVNQMHKNVGLSFDVFIERISVEMTHITGNKRRLKSQFLAMFERLFDENKLTLAEAALKNWERS